MKAKYDYSLLVRGYMVNGIEFIKELETKGHERIGIFVCRCGKEKKIALRKFLSNSDLNCRCIKPNYFSFKIGKVFNRLTVISDAEVVNGQSFVDVKCSCGTIRNVRCTDLKSGKLNSCGCFQKEKASEHNKTHGLSRTPLHKLWLKMRGKCTNKNSEIYHNYGGRGVIICSEWAEFINFHNWALANGYEKGLQLDKDILYREKHGTLVGMEYSPEYCQFVTPLENNQCKSTSRYIEYDGRIQTFTQWARELNIHSHTLSERLDRSKWSIEKAFSTPSERGFVPYKDKRVGRVHKKRINQNNNEKTSI